MGRAVPTDEVLRPRALDHQGRQALREKCVGIGASNAPAPQALPVSTSPMSAVLADPTDVPRQGPQDSEPPVVRVADLDDEIAPAHPALAVNRTRQCGSRRGAQSWNSDVPETARLAEHSGTALGVEALLGTWPTETPGVRTANEEFPPALSESAVARCRPTTSSQRVMGVAAVHVGRPIGTEPLAAARPGTHVPHRLGARTQLVSP